MTTINNSADQSEDMPDIERVTISNEELTKVYAKSKNGFERLVLALMETKGLRVKEATELAKKILKEPVYR